MKLGRVLSEGRTLLAAMREGQAVDLSEVVSGGSYRSVIENWYSYKDVIRDFLGSEKVQTIDNPVWICPFVDPPKFLLLAGNFRAHVVESGFAPLPDGTLTPQFFWKPNTSLIGPTDAIRIARENVAPDYEAELAIILGRKVKRATPEEALEAVWGYTIVNDFSERRLNANLPGRMKRQNDDFFDWLVGKWFDSSTPLGPYLVSKDEIGSVESLEITAKLNGEIVQHAPLSSMVHSIAEAICYISQLVTLEAGDILSMGTPEGVGLARGRLLQDGDVMECSVPGIGVLRNPVKAE